MKIAKQPISCMVRVFEHNEVINSVDDLGGAALALEESRRGV